MRPGGSEPHFRSRGPEELAAQNFLEVFAEVIVARVVFERVTFLDDGKQSSWLKEADVVSSGLMREAFDGRFGAKFRAKAMHALVEQLRGDERND